MRVVGKDEIRRAVPVKRKRRVIEAGNRCTSPQSVAAESLVRWTAECCDGVRAVEADATHRKLLRNVEAVRPS